LLGSSVGYGTAKLSGVQHSLVGCSVAHRVLVSSEGCSTVHSVLDSSVGYSVAEWSAVWLCEVQRSYVRCSIALLGAALIRRCSIVK